MTIEQVLKYKKLISEGWRENKSLASVDAVDILEKDDQIWIFFPDGSDERMFKGMKSVTVKFTISGKPYKFIVYHNMTKENFMIALQSWLARTKNFTANNLVCYILNKKTGEQIFTEKRYKELFPDVNKFLKKNV